MPSIFRIIFTYEKWADMQLFPLIHVPTHTSGSRTTHGLLFITVTRFALWRLERACGPANIKHQVTNYLKLFAGSAATLLPHWSELNLWENFFSTLELTPVFFNQAPLFHSISPSSSAPQTNKRLLLIKGTLMKENTQFDKMFVCITIWPQHFRRSQA